MLLVVGVGIAPVLVLVEVLVEVHGRERTWRLNSGLLIL